MLSWSPSAVVFPPQELAAARRSSKRLAYPEGSDPAAPPLRPERRVPTSIASIRTRLIRALVRTLHRCPCCQHVNTPEPTRRRIYEVRRTVAHHDHGDVGRRLPQYGGPSLHPDHTGGRRRISVRAGLWPD